MDIVGLIPAAYMTLLSVFDIRDRRLPPFLLWAGVILAALRILLIAVYIRPSAELAGILTIALLGAVPGLVMTGLSFLSDKIGRGDGIVLMAAGVCENFSFMTIVSCTACVVLAVFSGILLVMHRVSKNTKMPYIPFLTGTYIVLKIYERSCMNI